MNRNEWTWDQGGRTKHINRGRDELNTRLGGGVNEMYEQGEGNEMHD